MARRRARARTARPVHGELGCSRCRLQMRIRFRPQPAPLRFAVALAAVGAVFVLDYFVGSLIDDGSHFLLLGDRGDGERLVRRNRTGARRDRRRAPWSARGTARRSPTTCARHRHASRALPGPGAAADGAGLRAAPRPPRSPSTQANVAQDGAPRERSRRPHEGRVPRHHLPRAAHAAQLGARLAAPAAHRQARFGDLVARAANRSSATCGCRRS